MAAVLAAPRLLATRAAGGWLFGPAPDLLLGCGLLSLLAFGVFMLGGSAPRVAQPALVFPLGGATALVAAWFGVALIEPLAGSWLATLYLTWSPWHYTGQNYGLAAMFLRRRGVVLENPDKRWLYAAFWLSFALTFVAILDGAIRKLRGRIAAILIRSGSDDAAEEKPSSFARPLVWATCAALLAVAGWLVVAEETTRRALAANHLAAVSASQARLAALGRDSGGAHSALAAAHLERAVGLRPEDSELRAQRDQLARLIGPGVPNAAPTAERAQ